MKINLVNYEQGIGIKDGILTKFALEMGKELRLMDEQVSISDKPDPTADINHHINYLPYYHTDTINTLMITHFLDNKMKLESVKKSMETADMGICMSDEMVDYLKLPKLTSIAPPHHGKKRRPIVIAICTKVYPDGCKREWMLENLCKTIDKTKFAFRVIGDGWRPILEKLSKEGVMIDYCDHFDQEIYNLILDSSDYYLYFGLDEGSMGTVDAINAGLRVITTPIGFHKDMPINHPFESQKQLNAIFKRLAMNPVEHRTWKWYAEQHLAIWKKLYAKKTK